MTPEFKSYRSFLDFAESVTREWRFSRSAEQQEFLETVLATSHNRREQLDEGTVVWRAQQGHDWLSDSAEENACPFPPERMKPLTYRAAEGRANLKAYLISIQLPTMTPPSPKSALGWVHRSRLLSYAQNVHLLS